MRFIAGCYFFNEKGEKYRIKSVIRGSPPGTGDFICGVFDNYLENDKRIHPKDRGQGERVGGPTKIEKTAEQAKFDSSQLNLFAILLPYCKNKQEREDLTRKFYPELF